MAEQGVFFDLGKKDSNVLIFYRTKKSLHEWSIGGSPPSWHMHSVQSSILIHSPQQSPPSKVHPAMLASSLQNPLPINANGAAQLRSSKHMHSVQYCVSTFDPQQSPPSK